MFSTPRMLGSAAKQRMLLIACVGIGLTILTAMIDYRQWLGITWLENRLYDSRLYYCQHFSLKQHPPTTQLVHLDIDDLALSQAGKWPWPRERIAQIVNEIHDAGASVLFMDIIFPDQEVDKAGNVVTSGTDALAAAIKNFGHVVAPVSLQFVDTEEFTPLTRRMMAEYTTNPEITRDELVAKFRPLVGKDPALPRDVHLLDALVDPRIDTARTEAVYNRVSALVDQGVDSFAGLRASLLPHIPEDVTSAPLLDLLREQYDRVIRDRELRRFKLPIPRDVPPLAVAQHASEQVPLLAIDRAAAYSGYVDPLLVGDKHVRAVVLGVNSRGRMLPHASLALACAVLGVDIQKVEFHADHVTIPLPDGTERRIPVRTARNDSGEPIPLVMDIPWFGRDNWETMYDYPEYRQTAQHYSINKVWEIIRNKDIVESNARNLRAVLKRALIYINGPELGEVKYREFEAANLQGAALDKYLDDVVAQAKDGLSTFADVKPADLKKDDRDLYDALKRATDFIPRARATTADARTKVQDQLRELHETLSGKAVMIGWTATASFDFYPTPLHDRCPGVVALGAVMNGIKTGRYWETLPHWPTALSTILVGLSTTALVLSLTPTRAAAFTSLLAAGYLAGNGFLVFDYAGKVLGAAGPVVAMTSVWSVLTILKFTLETAERNRITARFRSYVDPKLVNYVLEHPDASTAGALQEMSVVFTDLEGFTTLSETLKEKTVGMLSDYMGRMVPLIRSHNGYVNKFLGDGIMFFFNAPVDPNGDHAADAVKAIIDMQRAMDPFNEELRSRGLPTLTMRAGITTGEMVVGDAGPGTSSDYTVLGDNVNLASRLESANKATGTHTMILWRTKDLLADRFLCRPIARLQVKGKTEGVMTYEPLAPTDMATDAHRRLVALSTAVVESYFNADFIACAHACDTMDAELGPSKFTKLYRREAGLRAEEFATPGFDPISFQGVITLSEK